MPQVGCRRPETVLSGNGSSHSSRRRGRGNRQAISFVRKPLLVCSGGANAFACGDIEGAFAVFAEDILWHVSGRGPLSRDYRGHAEVLEFFQHFMELSHGTFRIQVDDILAKGDRVVVLCTESAQRGRRSWSSPQVHVWAVKDARANVFWQY
ncbi:MAG: nuclear transport factor 2 family protein [Verrucomicrobia bacterium]|nr:nuclear transport factor 2 family protein [Verrucomicrobiota bacterium]